MAVAVGGDRDARLLAGRVGRAHGLDGSFYVTRPRPLLLREGLEVDVAGLPAPLRVVRRAGTDARPIVRLEGVAGREAAEALRGRELHVAVADAPALEPGEYWAEQLVGCVVRSRGVQIGVVSEMIGLPSCECLEVSREGASAPLLVPMVRDAIRSIDVGARLIEIDLEFLGEGPPAGSGGAGAG